MKITTVGWLSDTHADQQMYNARNRKIDNLYAFKATLEDMVSQGVDFIVHTGDLFNSTRPSSESVQFVQGLHAWAGDKQLPILCITGNHDYCSNTQWLEVLATQPGGGGFQVIDNKTVDLGGLKVRGYPSMGRETLMKRFAEDTLEGVDILCLHQPVQDFVGFISGNMLNIADIPDKMHVLLGDIHITDIRTRPSGYIIGYPGSTELCSASESEDKCWIKLAFDNGKLEKWERMAGHNRPVLRWQIETDDDLTKLLEDFDAVAETLQQRDSRTPMIFVRYPSNLSGVMPRIRQKLHPDDYIIIPQPVAVLENGTLSTSSLDDEPEVSILDLLQTQVPQSDGLYQVASQLLNPELDAKTALSSFVEERLKLAEVNEI